MQRSIRSNHKVFIPNDVFKLIKNKLTLPDLAKLSLVHSEEHASYKHYLEIVLSKPELLLRELCSLKLDDIFHFLIQYQWQINAACDHVLDDEGAENKMPAVVLKALVMPISGSVKMNIDLTMLILAQEYLEKENFPKHWIESIKFQTDVLDKIQSVSSNRNYSVSPEYLRFSNFTFKLNTLHRCECDCIKNLTGIEFKEQNIGRPVGKKPATFWKYTNFRNANLSQVSFSGASLTGAYIEFSSGQLPFVLCHYYMFATVPKMNYFHAVDNVLELTLALNNIYQAFSKNLRLTMSNVTSIVKKLLYRIDQDKFDGFDAAKTCSAVLPIIIPDITSQLLAYVAGMDATRGYFLRINALNEALHHPLFAIRYDFSDRISGLFNKTSLTASQKLISDAIAKYQQADASLQNPFNIDAPGH